MVTIEKARRYARLSKTAGYIEVEMADGFCCTSTSLDGLIDTVEAYAYLHGTDVKRLKEYKVLYDSEIKEAEAVYCDN